MFDLIEKEILKNIPPYKGTSGGWIKFDAPCCSHNHESIDRRGRGNLLITGNGDIVYNCYNCKFKTGWRQGDKYLGKKFKSFLSWIGLSESEIQAISFEAFKNCVETNEEKTKSYFRPVNLDFTEKVLPKSFIKVEDSLECEKYNNNEDLLNILEYLYTRGDRLFNLNNYYWCPDIKYHMMRNRVIIPFYWNDKIVGYTGRYIGKPPNKETPRYFSDIPKDYIFNTEAIKKEHNYIFLVEGPFDALAINGISILGDKCSKNQIEWIKKKALVENKRVIVIPDQEKYGGELLKIAIDNEWEVSFPYWENCKDAADATKKYGYIPTVQSILSRLRSSENGINQLKLQCLGK